jgi:hypothetical protein
MSRAAKKSAPVREASVFKALGHPARLQVVNEISAG